MQSHNGVNQWKSRTKPNEKPPIACLQSSYQGAHFPHIFERNNVMKHHSKHPPIVELKARAFIGDAPYDFKVKGQTARALHALHRAKDSGITALEVSSWALRLAAYVHTLRDKHGLHIETKTERFGKASLCGRYVLHTKIELVSVIFE
jgi:hypothetical protein